MMNELVDREFDFYGVDNCEFKLDGTVYEAVEDPSDGYRSCLGSIEVRDSKGIFFQMPLARVRVQANNGASFDGWDLVDVEDGHVWLTVGTDNYDDYYPCFTFNYQPKRTQVIG